MENTKTAMVAAVAEALRYQKNPWFLGCRKQKYLSILKPVVFCFLHKEINPKAADDEIISHVVKMADAIIKNIG